MKLPISQWFARREKVPLRLVIAVPFVLQTLGTVALVGYLSHQSGQKAVESLAHRLMQEVSDRINLYLTDYVKTPQIINQLNVNAVRLNQINLLDAQNLERHFLQQIQTFDSLNRIYFSNPEGGLISVGSDDRGLTVASTENFRRGTLRVYRVDPQNEPKKLLIEQQNYDARERPFYQQALAIGKPTWTSPYAYIPTSAGSGIAATYPLYNQNQQLQGVLSSDLTLTGIHQFLKDLEIGSHGAVFIMERSGLLVASSTAENPFASNGNAQTDQPQTKRLKATESHEPTIRLTAQHLSAHFGDLSQINTATQLEFALEGNTEFLQVVPFKDQFGLDWLIVIVVPESDFMAEIYRNAAVTTLLCAVTLILSAAIGMLVSQWLTKPILQLNRAAKQVAQGDLNTVIALNRPDELGELAQSFDDMILQLKTAFAGMRVLNQIVTENEQRMTQILETLPIGVSMHRPDGSILYINSSGKQLLGITDLAETATKLLPLHQPERSNTQLQSTTSSVVQSLGHQQSTVQDIEIDQHGKQLSFEVHSASVFDGQGNVVALITAFQDITQRKTAEKILANYNQHLEAQVIERSEALRQSEALNRAIRDALPDLLIRMRIDGTYLDVKYPTNFVLINAHATVPGGNVKDILPPQEAEHRLAAAQQALKTGIIQVYEFPFPTEEPPPRWFEVRVVPFTHDEVLVFIQDITVRKQVELELRRQKELRETIYNESTDAIFLVDPKTLVIIDCNQRAVELFEADCKEELIGMEGRALQRYPFTPKEVEQIVADMEQQGFWISEVEYVTCKGNYFWGSLAAKPVQIANQTIHLVRVTNISERKRAEAALRLSEERNRAILTAIPDLITIMNSEGIYLDIVRSDTLIDLIPADANPIGRHITDFLPLGTAARKLQAIRQALTTRTVQVYEQQLRIEDKLQYEEVRIVPYGEDTVLLMLRDVTDRKQAEEALRQSEAIQRQILKAIPDLLIWMDQNGTQLQKICGKTAQDIAEGEFSQNIYDILPRQLAQKRTHMVQQALQTCEVQIYEQELVIRGQIHYEEVRVVAVEVDRVLVIVRDITDRKQAEQQLKASLQREQAVARVIDRMHRKLDLASIFATTTQELRQAMNGDRVVIYRFNPDWSGNFVAESIGSGWIPVIPFPDDVSQPNPNYDQNAVENGRCVVKNWDKTTKIVDTYLQETQGGIYCEDTTYVCIDDIYKAGFTPCYVELLEQFQARAYIIVPIHLDAKLWGLLAVYQNSGPRQWQDTDVQIMIQVGQQLGVAVQQAELLEQTQRQAVELMSAKEAAETASRAKSSFLANISHELRTPLNAILGFTQLMEQELDTTPTQREYLAIINRNGEYLLQLINDVLSISKIEAGRISLQEKSFDLYALLDTLAGMFRLQAETKGLQFIYDRSPLLPQYIYTDEPKLRQVITNLLDNAIKFTSSGSITLRIQVQDNLVASSPMTVASHPNSLYLSFEVADTGVGIAVEELDAVFEAFVQAEAGQQSQQGTGLGLPISRRFVQMMGGDINISSQPGQGSTFCFYIRAALADAVTGRQPSSGRVIGLAPDQPTYRILVVDDTDTNRQLMVKWLTTVGMEVCEAKNGQEAIEQWLSFAPDLIWMDMRMPIMDGFEAVRQIRAQEKAAKGSATKIIAITAAVFEEERQAILAAGCDDFVGKPCSEASIFDKIAQHLGTVYIQAQETISCSLNQQPNLQPDLTQLIQAGLATMPNQWIAQLNRAALIANDQAIFQILEELPESQIALKEAIIQLVNAFRLDQLIQLTQSDL